MPTYKFEKGSAFAMPEVTFNAEPSANGSLYKHLKAAPDFAYTPKVAVVERTGFIETMNRIPHVIGAQSGNITLKTETKGSGTPGTGLCVSAESHELLEAMLGASFHGTGTTVNDMAATTTSFTVADATGLRKGMMVIVDCGAPHGYVPRFITGIVGSVITLNRALPAAPADAAVVQASTTYSRAASGQKSLAIVARRDGILYTFLGCKVDSFNISGVEANGIAMFEFVLSCTTWNTNAKNSLPSTVLAGATAAPPPVIKGACYSVGGVEELVYSLAFNAGIETAFKDSTCAQGPSVPTSINADFALTKATPTLAVKSWFASSHMTDFAAGTEREVAFAAGAGLGNAWGLFVPKAQLTDSVEENRNGMVGESLNFAINDAGSDAEYVISLA